MINNEQREQLVCALRGRGRAPGNWRLREILGWNAATYDALSAALIADGTMKAGWGRDGAVALVGIKSDIQKMVDEVLEGVDLPDLAETRNGANLGFKAKL